MGLGALLASALLGAATSPDARAVRWLGEPPSQPARRVVTLAPSLTDIVLALGEGERLVAVSRFDDRPEVARLARIGGYNDPSVEAIVRQRPELILAQPAPNNRAAVEKLAALGFPVLVLPMGDLASTFAAIKAVGEALGATGRADALVDAATRSFEVVRRRTGALRPVRVLLVFSLEPLVVAGDRAYPAELLAALNVVNLASGVRGDYTTYPLERLVGATPDVVLDASSDSHARTRLAALLRDRCATRWVPVDTALLRPSPQPHAQLLALEPLLRPAGLSTSVECDMRSPAATSTATSQRGHKEAGLGFSGR